MVPGEDDDEVWCARELGAALGEGGIELCGEGFAVEEGVHRKKLGEDSLAKNGVVAVISCGGA